MSLFDMMLVLHITAGSICLAAGALAAGVKKRKGFTPSLWLWFLPTIIGTPIISLVSRRYTKSNQSNKTW
ncbi:hypothetical protein [Brevibacillus massiliensis]|uniref:hypothetical protein n=1 Tax=Brevibacillus massiliensis TaxID=1118054 RepID=UPI00030EF7F8|nr:hypothetical protein [Brevibacillus massiliensis]